MIGKIIPGTCIYKIIDKNVNTNLHGNNIIDLQLVDGVFTKSLRNQFVNTAAALVIGFRQIDMRTDFSARSLQNQHREVSYKALDPLTFAIIKTLLKGMAFACIGHAVSMAGVFTQFLFLVPTFIL